MRDESRAVEGRLRGRVAAGHGFLFFCFFDEEAKKKKKVMTERASLSCNSPLLFLVSTPLVPLFFFFFLCLVLAIFTLHFFPPSLFRSRDMDAATLRSLALRGGGFSTPRLNDSLQAHGAGLSGFVPSSSLYRETAAAGTESPQSPLAAYSGLKSLNLADNGFESLEGMPRLEELRCL